MSIGTPRLLTAGKSSILVETDSPTETLGLVEQLRRCPPSGMIDFLPAETTVMIFARPDADMSALRSEIGRLSLTSTSILEHAQSDDVVIVPVHYDGEDLAELAHITGLSVRDIIARHTDELWRCSFIGFAPGFSYLSPTSATPWTIPRREQARPSVPPGSVALASRYCAVYPRSSPGGWQLIGRTDMQMWDIDNDPPALVQPGRVVRFVDADKS
ncbi:allophanate hydrolase subunit 1 [Rhodococcus sp. KBS0724]|uniref:5-oxoprolinase subunit B family protein n=1 Tax=Rhodococcus sp. KBS0724 TaxID=1179674 RepID=UPI00110E3E5E|nr:allophanate hydrolase subunit 1 [Rhodococcus sp. KBS0724]TSD40401.1 allophanate hydrolase subunit 1 [Rhodococcus sp. KBS0724]